VYAARAYAGDPEADPAAAASASGGGWHPAARRARVGVSPRPRYCRSVWQAPIANAGVRARLPAPPAPTLSEPIRATSSPIWIRQRVCLRVKVASSGCKFITANVPTRRQPERTAEASGCRGLPRDLRAPLREGRLPRLLEHDQTATVGGNPAAARAASDHVRAGHCLRERGGAGSPSATREPGREHCLRSLARQLPIAAMIVLPCAARWSSPFTQRITCFRRVLPA
jgi:hypothetical protein